MKNKKNYKNSNNIYNNYEKMELFVYKLLLYYNPSFFFLQKE